MTEEQLEALRVWVQHEVESGVIRMMRKAHYEDKNTFYINCPNKMVAADHAYDVVKETFGITPEDDYAEDHY